MLLGRVVGAAQARGHLAVAAALAERLGGRPDLALALLDDAIARFGAVGDIYGTGYALGQRGHTLRWAGDLTGALAAFDAAEQIHRSLRDLRSTAMTVAGRSYVAALLGESAVARRHVQEAVSMMERSGDLAGVAHTLDIHTLVELELGAVDAALVPWSGACRSPTARARRSTRSAGSTCSSPTSAGPSATSTPRLVPRPRRRGGSGCSATGAVWAHCKGRAKRERSPCRPDNDPSEDDMTQLLGDATINELEGGIAGSLVRPGDDAYEEARHIWNGAIDKRPAMIVRPAHTADVVANRPRARRARASRWPCGEVRTASPATPPATMASSSTWRR